MRWAWVRTATVIVVALVLLPLLTLYAYLLLWFLPDLTSNVRPALWLVTFTLWAGAVGFLVVGWFRRHRSARWWRWLPAAALCAAAAFPLVERF